jgi:hypothetical protein
MAVDTVLLRVRIEPNKQGREKFNLVLRKSLTKQHKKLGLYDKATSSIEEWCHKDDYEFFTKKD